MTKFAILIGGAALLLAACQPAEVPVDEARPIPPATPATRVIEEGGLVDPTPLRSSLLGEINGCRIYRITVDGRSFVLANAYISDTTASGYVRTCELASLDSLPEPAS